MSDSTMEDGIKQGNRKECQICSKLATQVAALKEVGALRKSLLELREKESEGLIEKLKLIEEAVERERNLRLELAKRVEAAEQRVADLNGSLQAKEDVLREMETQYNAKISGLLTNIETYHELLKVSKRDLVETKDKNTELCNQLIELKMAAKKKNNNQ